MHLHYLILTLGFILSSPLNVNASTSDSAPQRFNAVKCAAKLSSQIDSGAISRSATRSSHINDLFLNGTYIGEERKVKNITMGGIITDGLMYYLPFHMCDEHCGKRWAPYDIQAILIRLTTWMLPVLLLVGNISFADLGAWAGIRAVLHVLGDPIDSIWSLLTTLELRRRGYVWALLQGYSDQVAQAVAEIAAIANEVDPTLSDDPQALRRMLASWKGRNRFEVAAVVVAREIRDVRARDTTRSGLAILVYLASVTSAFISAFKFQQDKPGNRIAFSILYSWLIVLVIMSSVAGKANTVGCYPRCLKHFNAYCSDHERCICQREVDDAELVEKTRPTPILWNGPMNTFRYQKSVFSSGSSSDYYRHPWILLVASSLPVIVSACFALRISWLSPEQGLKCKTLCMLVITLGWATSVVITTLCWRLSGNAAARKKAATIILAKDTLIGISAIILIIIASYGVFNSCYCEAAAVGGGKDVGLELDSNWRRAKLLQSEYPALALANIANMLSLVAIYAVLVGIVTVPWARKDSQSVRSKYIRSNPLRSHH